MTGSELLWASFAVGIAAMLVVDLGILQKKAHAVSMREAGAWVLVWLTLAMAFAAAIGPMEGARPAMIALAGYLLEQSLSVDNMFVFIMIFSYFAVEREYQPRILHWGILGAIVLRFIFIFAGVGLIRRFDWMFYVFGAMLLFTGAKMALQ